MIRNNIKLALRLLLKHKSISIINIIGLSFSMACVLFILLWVQQELSFDRFHPHYRQICRVEENQYYSNPEPYHVNVTPHPAGPVWKDEIPEITEQCRVAFSGGMLLSYDHVKFFENDVVATDSSYFRIFGFELLYGTPGEVLNAPNTIVLSEEIALKYFGTTQAIGKVLKVDNDELYTVTGIMKDPPENTILPAKILLPWSYREQQNFYSENWGNNSIFTFVKLVPGTSVNVINDKITEVTNMHKENNTITFEVNPIHRIHLHAYFGFGKSPGAVMYVYIFSAVAIFVLVIACINFMNMSTARSSTRSKEIGLRKVNGASRPRLIRQHMSESFVQTFISGFIALLLVILLLYKFNDISGKNVGLGEIFNWKYLSGLLVVILFTGILSGIYPAFHLSSLQPARAIRQQNDTRTGSGLLRKILVVFQFSLSILLVSGAIVVKRQLNFMQNADLGFDKYQLLTIPLQGGLADHYETLKDEVMKHPGIENVTASTDQPFRIGSNSSNINWQGKDPENEVLVSFTAVGFDYATTMKINLIKGRDFSADYRGDMYQDTVANWLINKTMADIIERDLLTAGNTTTTQENFAEENETAAKDESTAMDESAATDESNAIDESATMDESTTMDEIVGMQLNFMGMRGQVIGVMEDFNFKPLSNEVEPLVTAVFPSPYFMNMIVRLRTTEIQPVLKDLETTWNTIVPDYPFNYSFVDEEIDNMYRSEQRMSILIGIFTFVAIVIACMGLFALASFNAERRTREIGVRKTFGASEAIIAGIMLVDITRLVIISLVIGLPVTWFLASRWLQDFYYRIDLSADIFLVSAILIILVSLATILYHAIRSSRLNPVTALRYE